MSVISDAAVKRNSGATLPLGVFDSGVGGLTVARAIREALPQESILYLGDTARVPYGNKSPETVLRYAREDCAFLLSRGVKAIVVACNTASAHALPALQQEVPVPIFGVVEPGVAAALAATRSGRIGIIGTQGTIGSGAYQERLLRSRPDLILHACATPLLVPLVEEDWVGHVAARLVLEEYLAPIRAEGVDTLVLGCTHYPLLREAIRGVMGAGVALVDSAESCAATLHKHLEETGALAVGGASGTIEICLTDRPSNFANIAQRFLATDLPPVQVVTLPTLSH